MISVVIPVYNVEDYIANSIKSILKQTYTDYELILVDDGSSDRSIEVAEELLEINGFKKYVVIKEENSGQGVARNIGMSKVRGEWIYFMDSDDMLPENTLSVMVRAAEKTLADIVFCGFEFSENGLIEKSEDNYKTNIYTSEAIQLEFLLRRKKILVPGTLYKSDWLRDKKIVFPSLRFSEDVYFLWNAIIKAKRVTEVEGCLYTYIVRGNSTMTRPPILNIKKSYEKFCELNIRLQTDRNVIEEVKKWMLPRWVFGVMRASAGVMKWDVYKKLMGELSYKRHCKNLKGFPDIRVSLMRKLVFFNLSVFYMMASKWNPYI